ncbi:MAG: hypothetical protein OEZ32_05470 [Nitrospinota bacterium]|nr:hypothetical protein [Nitrospinota bacterium]
MTTFIRFAYDRRPCFGRLPGIGVLSLLLILAGIGCKGSDNASSGFADCGVDIHQHLNTASNPVVYPSYATTLVELMVQVGIHKSIIMPPSTSADSSAGVHYSYMYIMGAAASQPGRLAVSGGGGILNSVIRNILGVK